MWRHLFLNYKKFMLYSNWLDKECILISVWGLVQCLLSSKWKNLIGRSGWKFENDFSLAVNNIWVHLFYFRCVPLSSRTTALHDLYSVHRINCDLCFDRETDWKIGYMNCDLEKHPDYLPRAKKQCYSTQKMTEQRKFYKRSHTSTYKVSLVWGSISYEDNLAWVWLKARGSLGTQVNIEPFINPCGLCSVIQWQYSLEKQMQLIVLGSMQQYKNFVCGFRLVPITCPWWVRVIPQYQYHTSWALHKVYTYNFFFIYIYKRIKRLFVRPSVRPKPWLAMM